ncbi:hypothetical protein L6452_44270 [Arctium lappa]|uniref:Uncharacterized protein n=1 Tax=Arctium lappa TaxID=4217 RepID=A0ACB8XFP8_ARCLA|nr:hypothetical protein L6452_44270 [Arctium lappa]
MYGEYKENESKFHAIASRRTTRAAILTEKRGFEGLRYSPTTAMVGNKKRRMTVEDTAATEVMVAVVMENLMGKCWVLGLGN